MDTVGNFTCTCDTGYTGDGITCDGKIFIELTPVALVVKCFYTSDIDECQGNSIICNENAECSNTVGNYTCLCQPGYTGDGESCNSK